MPVVFLTDSQVEALDYRVIGTVAETITITHANADTNQAGASNSCKRATIKAHPANTGIAWVQFGAAAVDVSAWPLNANESVSVPIDDTDEINVLFKVGGEKVEVAYSV